MKFKMPVSIRPDRVIYIGDVEYEAENLSEASEKYHEEAAKKYSQLIKELEEFNNVSFYIDNDFELIDFKRNIIKSGKQVNADSLN
jgi:hypothetical protein